MDRGEAWYRHPAPVADDLQTTIRKDSVRGTRIERVTRILVAADIKLALTQRDAME